MGQASWPKSSRKGIGVYTPTKYGLEIVDDYSRFTWVFFVYDKSQVQEKGEDFCEESTKGIRSPYQENEN